MPECWASAGFRTVFFIWAPGCGCSGRRRRADARGGWPDVGTGFIAAPGAVQKGPNQYYGQISIFCNPLIINGLSYSKPLKKG